jgi:hypothetical protein
MQPLRSSTSWQLLGQRPTALEHGCVDQLGCKPRRLNDLGDLLRAGVSLDIAKVVRDVRGEGAEAAEQIVEQASRPSEVIGCRQRHVHDREPVSSQASGEVDRRQSDRSSRANAHRIPPPHNQPLYVIFASRTDAVCGHRVPPDSRHPRALKSSWGPFPTKLQSAGARARSARLSALVGGGVAVLVLSEPCVSAHVEIRRRYRRGRKSDRPPAHARHLLVVVVARIRERQRRTTRADGIPNRACL